MPGSVWQRHRVRRGLRSDPHPGNTWLCPSSSFIQPTYLFFLFQMGSCCFRFAFSLTGHCKDLSADTYLVQPQEAVSRAPVSPASC